MIGGHPFYVLNIAADRQKVNYESQPQSAIGAWICARQLKITDKVTPRANDAQM